ncbi:hypothetical protein DFP72DRAFT_1061500 [Ephemerocybe angulata]|uniref:Uncharacterized protein n=1 Tax=Ephemerocybe angulata TaxID=980116 RepID=A0A8H6MEL1_9AGAR|nr:hypothetical protein DFP72DRAFT_1061500 [Tulosesus angulatus]
MPSRRPLLSSLRTTFKSLLMLRKHSATTPAEPGSRPSTITCRANGKIEASPTLTEPTTSNEKTTSPAKKRRFRRSLFKEKGDLGDSKTDPASSLPHTLPDDDASTNLQVAEQPSSSRMKHTADSSTAAQRQNDIRVSRPASCTSHEPAWQAPGRASMKFAALAHVLLERPAEPHTLHEMLCNIQPTLVCEQPDVDTRTFTERDNDALRGYFSVKTNIVLTSICPEVVPHIVITPAQPSPEDYFVPWLNRVDYHLQHPGLLLVPAFDASRLSRMPGCDEESYWPVARSQGKSMDGIPPRVVFSKSRFNRLIEVTASERLTMYHVVTALQRHRLKALAIEVSECAKILSDRYDPEYLESLEKPFQWTDPAEPLLETAGYQGVQLLFDSMTPFSVPHILLCTPPAQDPWIPYSTATNDPQDCGFGRYLVVPSQQVSFINMAGDYDDDYDICETPSDSEPSTPEPMTPPDLEIDSYFWRDPDAYANDNDDEAENDQYDDPEYVAYDRKIDEIETQDIPSRPGKPIFYFDDEDEDDLPPLDDWYISVARRNGVELTTS